jgi:ubiquinone/menaquinone biosynthesis C-methylase UbiE
MCITNGRKKRWLLLMRGELHKAPINNPQKVLDLGTGTGIWALDFAE